MMNVVRGLSFILVNGTAIFVNDYRLLYLGRARWLGIPLPIIIVLFSFVVLDFILRNTVFGRQVFSSGGNRIAARLAGIDVNKNTVILFVLSGFMASIAGLITVGIGGAACPIRRINALDAVTAVLLGGTTLAGGKGSVRMTFLGVLIIGILTTHEVDECPNVLADHGQRCFPDSGIHSGQSAVSEENFDSQVRVICRAGGPGGICMAKGMEEIRVASDLLILPQ
jgi:ribose/xylose/arabinose/galactoside ABC-type transport system permease subunit